MRMGIAANAAIESNHGRWNAGLAARPRYTNSRWHIKNRTYIYTYAHGRYGCPSAAFEVGYESPSQFSREYSRFFGQPPMRDIKVRRGISVATGRISGHEWETAE
jgi:hypothetical protein